MKNKVIFGLIIVAATAFVLNQAKKNPTGIFGSLANIGS